MPDDVAVKEPPISAPAPAPAPNARQPDAAPPPDKAAPTSILDDVADDDAADDAIDPALPGSKTADAPAWPDDWRAKLANGDDKLAKRLQRFTSPENILKSWLAAEQKIKSGEYRKVPGEDASDEERAEYLKEIGVPEAPDKYDTTVENYKWADEDQPLIGSFLEHLHKAGTPQPVAKAALQWYADRLVAAKEERTALDTAQRDEMSDKLHSEWGADFRANINLLNRFLKDSEALPNDLGGALKQARMPDGSLLVNHPAFATSFVQLARERYGDAGMISGDALAAQQSREAELVAMMKNDADKYFNGRNAKGQSFADELLEIRREKESRESSRR